MSNTSNYSDKQLSYVLSAFTIFKGILRIIVCISRKNKKLTLWSTYFSDAMRKTVERKQQGTAFEGTTKKCSTDMKAWTKFYDTKAYNTKPEVVKGSDIVTGSGYCYSFERWEAATSAQYLITWTFAQRKVLRRKLLNV